SHPAGRGGRRRSLRSHPHRRPRSRQPELLELRGSELPERRPDVGTDRHPASVEHDLRGRVEREPVERGAQAFRVFGPLRRARAAPPAGERPRRPEAAPAAPRSSPRTTSDSAPTKTSSPGSKYGSTRSHGRSETFSPRRFGRVSRRRSTSDTGTA